MYHLGIPIPIEADTISPKIYLNPFPWINYRHLVPLAPMGTNVDYFELILVCVKHTLIRGDSLFYAFALGL